MSHRWPIVFLLVCAAMCEPVAAADEPKPKPKLDHFGDPLPDGARLRLGTERFRHGGEGQYSFALFPDGKSIACFGGGYLTTYDAETGAVLKRIRSEENHVNDLAIAADGKRLVTAGAISHGVGKGTVGALRVWDAQALVEQKVILWEIGVPRNVLLLDGGKVAATADDAQIRLWDLDGTDELPRFDAARASAVAASPDGSVIAVAEERGTIHLWEWKTKNEPRRFNLGVARRPQCLAFSPDGKTLVVGDDYMDGVTLWDVESRKKRLTLPHEATHGVRSIVFTRDGKHLITPYYVNRIDGYTASGLLVWDASDGKKVRFIEVPAGTLALSRDGSRLLNGTRVWDTKTWKLLGPEETGHRGNVGSIAVSKNGLILTGGDDRTARLWDLKDGRLIHTFQCPNWVRGAALSADGSLAGVHSPDELLIWNTSTGKMRFRLPGHTVYGQHSLGISDDGKRLLSFGSSDLFLRVTDLSSGKALLEHAIRPEGVKINDPEMENDRDRFMRDIIFSKASFTPDGKLMLLSLKDELRVFDVASAKELRRLAGSRSSPCAISPDSRSVLIVQRNPVVRDPMGKVVGQDPTETIRFLKIEDGEAVGAMSFRDGRIRSVACAADGKHFAAATLGKTPQVHLCKLGDDKPFKSFDLPALPSFALAFSPDGKSLAVAMTGGSVLVYDVPIAKDK